MKDKLFAIEASALTERQSKQSTGLPTLLIYQDSPDFKGPLLVSCFLCYISLLISFFVNIIAGSRCY